MSVSSIIKVLGLAGALSFISFQVAAVEPWEEAESEHFKLVLNEIPGSTDKAFDEFTKDYTIAVIDKTSGKTIFDDKQFTSGIIPININGVSTKMLEMIVGDTTEIIFSIDVVFLWRSNLHILKTKHTNQGYELICCQRTWAYFEEIIIKNNLYAHCTGWDSDANFAVTGRVCAFDETKCRKNDVLLRDAKGHRIHRYEGDTTASKEYQELRAQIRMALKKMIDS
jgi:hypothetical protein